MNQLLVLFWLIPFVGFIASLCASKENEKLLSKLSIATVGVELLLAISFVIFWLFNKNSALNIKELVLFKDQEYEFFIDLFYDKISAIFLLVGAILTFLITVYSRYYLHREKGYKRFFNTILFFHLGYNVAVLSGNFETLFLGWELIGISSFLLIAFYRERYLPVKNAFKVYSIYRIGDVGLLLAMWMSHHLWHENITFSKLNQYNLVHEQLLHHSFVGIFLSLCIVLAAAVKSAQFPFSSWLPRAMEGPTPSSAIFYGSLSVHLGVFLLLRTQPFWSQLVFIKVNIVVLGVVTTLVASLIARVQSSIKAQIAYASIAQIGIIFIEIALGFETLALVHFAGNAFFRTYQLLVSPSAVTYLIREQFYNFKPRISKRIPGISTKIQNAVYMLSLKEWNLDSIMYRFLWQPVKALGKPFRFIAWTNLARFFIPLYIAGWVLYGYRAHIPNSLEHFFPFLFAAIGLALVLKAFTERRRPTFSIILVVMNHLWVALAVSFNDDFNFFHVSIFLVGVIWSGVVALLALRRLSSLEKVVTLNRFQGHIYEHPKIGLIFFLACLGLAGFPITTAFLGEDLIFTHIESDQLLLAFFVALSFVIDGLALIRVYARVFLGPHIKTYHETAHRSS